MKKYNFLEPFDAFNFLYNGGELKKEGQTYTIIFCEGKIQTKETGTLIGNLNNLYKF